MNITEQRAGKIRSLNGWRALAIGMVMVYHCIYTKGFPLEKIPYWGRFLFDQGILGVRIFFVISGFLITYLLLKEGNKTNAVSLRNFYIRRCLRIMPLYFSYLGILACLSILGLYSDSFNSWFGALTFTRNIFGTGGSATGHYWSLAIEEQFYLVWPVLIALLALWKKRGTATWMLAGVILICPLVRALGFNSHENGLVLGKLLGSGSIFAYADSLAVGCLGAIFAVNKTLPDKAPFWASIMSVAIIFGGAVWLYYDAERKTIIDSIIPTLQAVAIMGAMWCSIVNDRSIMYWFLNLKFVNWIGLISYSLYVWQQIFTSVHAGPILSKWFVYDWRIWWIMAMFAAVVSYYCIERPILRFKDKFSTV